MRESTAQCIRNCFNIELGTHPMYRNFGLNVVDAANAPVQRDVLVQLSTYYPEVSLSDLRITKVNGAGQFEYQINIGG